MEANEQDAPQQRSNKPAFSARRGRLILKIWANETEQGTRHSSEITRSWKDGDDFRSTTRLDEQDLLAAPNWRT